MAGMEGLGRVFNAIPVPGASANTGFKVRAASAVTVFAWVTATGATSTIAVTTASSFAGSYTAAFVIKDIYWTTAINGTAAWQKVTFNPNAPVAPFNVNGALNNNLAFGPVSGFTFSNAGNTLATALLVCFCVFTSEFSDPTNYMQVANTGGTGATIFALPHDLVHQRAPANLEIQSS